MTNQYMTKLYHDLLSNSPQTVTIDIPHWPEHYEVLSYHFWPAYRQNRLSVFVPEDRCIPLGEI